MLRALLILLLAIVVVRAFWRVLGGIIEGATGGSLNPRAQPPGVQMIRDPVCGTFVVPDRAVTLVEGRRRVYFCSDACRDKYRPRTA